MDEQDRRPVASMRVVHAQRAELCKTGIESLAGRTLQSPNHCSGRILSGAGSPEILAPDGKVAVFVLLITVTAPAPMARHSSFIQTAALRSSMPSKVVRGSSRCADSTHRWPNVSKCGNTAVSGTNPSASVGRRLNRFGHVARMSE